MKALPLWFSSESAAAEVFQEGVGFPVKALPLRFLSSEGVAVEVFLARTLPLRFSSEGVAAVVFQEGVAAEVFLARALPLRFSSWALPLRFFSRGGCRRGFSRGPPSFKANKKFYFESFISRRSIWNDKFSYLENRGEAYYERCARGAQNTSSPDGPVGTGSSVAHERVRVSALCRL